MAQVGSRLIDAAAGKVAEDFFKAFEAAPAAPAGGRGAGDAGPVPRRPTPAGNNDAVVGRRRAVVVLAVV